MAKKIIIVQVKINCEEARSDSAIDAKVSPLE